MPRYDCIPAESAAVSPGKIIVPRIVVGGVILSWLTSAFVDAVEHPSTLLDVHERPAATRRPSRCHAVVWSDHRSLWFLVPAHGALTLPSVAGRRFSLSRAFPCV